MKTLTGQDDSYTMKPVAFVRCQSYYRYETPRQPEFSNIPAVIEFQKGQNFETALADLKGFERIWVIFVFHLNCRWSPKVRPPLSPDGAKYGLYATRSPHRPNRIGMSCVKLLDVDGTRLTIENSDMLDGTPVLDIKPYLPFADAKPDASGGFAEPLREYALQVEFPEALLSKVPPQYRAPLKEILAQDPRPAYQQDPLRVYGFPFADLEIRFSVEGERLTVLSVEERL